MIFFMLKPEVSINILNLNPVFGVSSSGEFLEPLTVELLPEGFCIILKTGGPLPCPACLGTASVTKHCNTIE